MCTHLRCRWPPVWAEATKRLPSTALTNRPPTLATVSPEHPATHRPVPRAPRPHHRFSAVISPPTEHHRRGNAVVVSLRPPYRHPRVPLGPSFLPGTTFSGESPPAGGATPAKGGIESPTSLSGWKAEIGPGLSKPTGPSRSRCSLFAQCRFIISTRIYSFRIQNLV
jgi:hypothetical protein